MDATMFVELISSVGFPIAVVVALGVFVFKLWQQSVDREKTLMIEIEENRKVNEKAIETIALYAERLTHIEHNIDEIKGDVIVIKQNLNQ